MGIWRVIFLFWTANKIWWWLPGKKRQHSSAKAASIGILSINQVQLKRWMEGPCSYWVKFLFRFRDHSDVPVMNASHRHSSSPVSQAYCAQLGMKTDIQGSTAHALIHHWKKQQKDAMASQQVFTWLPCILNFARRMIQCFHKGEAAWASSTMITHRLLAFVLMSPFYIHYS